jgi:hypothetical protein
MLKFAFDTLDEVNLILEALGEMPAKRSFMMLNKLHAQLQPQLQAQAASAAPAVEKPPEPPTVQ